MPGHIETCNPTGERIFGYAAVFLARLARRRLSSASPPKIDDDRPVSVALSAGPPDLGARAEAA